VIETGRRRVYIADDDMDTLVDHSHQRVTKGDDKPKNDDKTDRLCSVKDVALYLDLSPNSVRNWIRQANIELKTKFSDRDIACTTYENVAQLTDLHRRAIVANPSSLTLEEEIKELKEVMEKLAADIEDIKHDLRLIVKRSIDLG
jgi:hypothetical protein